MDSLILMVFIGLIISLNILFLTLFFKRSFSPLISGMIMMILTPVFGFSSGALFYQFYDWSGGGTGEGAGYGGAFIGIITLLNGVIIFIIGLIRWTLSLFKAKMNA